MTQRSASGSALQGRTIVVMRPGDGGNALCAALSALGATAVHTPLIAIVPPTDSAALEATAATLDTFDWVVFSSANALRTIAVGALPTHVRIAAVGNATAAAIETLGWPVHFVPTTSDGASLARQLPARPGQRALLPRGASGLPHLADGLRARRISVQEVIAYRTVPDASSLVRLSALQSVRVDAVVFSSPSTVMHLMLQSTLLAWNPLVAQCKHGMAVVCIGVTTASTAEQHGLHVSAIARSPGNDGIIDALVSVLSHRSGNARD